MWVLRNIITNEIVGGEFSSQAKLAQLMGMNPRTLSKAVKEGRNTFKFRGKKVCVFQLPRFSVHDSSGAPLKFFEKETQVAEWVGVSRQTIYSAFKFQTEKTFKKDGKEWIVKRICQESPEKEIPSPPKSSPEKEVPSFPKLPPEKEIPPEKEVPLAPKPIPAPRRKTLPPPIPAPRRKTLPPPIPAPRRKAATPPSPIPAEEKKEEKKEEEKEEKKAEEKEEKYCWPPVAQDPRNPFHPDLLEVSPDGCNIHNAICDFYENYNLFLPEGKRVKGWGEKKNKPMQTVLVAPYFMDFIGPTDTYEDFEFYCVIHFIHQKKFGKVTLKWEFFP